MNQQEIEIIRNAARIRMLFLPHAVRQMARPDRMIAPSEVEFIIGNGEIIENYPNDERGQSYLLLGTAQGRKIHVVCSPKENYLAIITAYIPDVLQWDSTLKKRRS